MAAFSRESSGATVVRFYAERRVAVYAPTTCLLSGRHFIHHIKRSLPIRNMLESVMA